ncbi:MAG: hypothetical protein H7288_14235 [Kineosporiaceae bacterium]|nr:hypothetical protein [Aeromicrobium sp.]
MTAIRGLLVGLAAGAAGTTALNAVTYVDIVVRARPSSSTPEDMVEKLSELTGLKVPGQGDERSNRVAGLGPLTGLITGLGIGAAWGLAKSQGVRLSAPVATLAIAFAALVGSDAPMATLGVSDPRSWHRSEWLADAIPHLLYGLVTATVAEALDPR